jgi:hypothetical protein
MHEEAYRSVVQVSDGRGFVVQGDERYIITASHCLPRLPEPPFDMKEVTYPALVGPLGAVRTVWAQCLFADPVADIAVLGTPDNQALFKEAEAYEELVNQAEPLSMRPCQDPDSFRIIEEEGWLFELDASHWFRCTVESIKQDLWVTNAAEPIRGGMSGSPILAADGTVIGIVCVGEVGKNDEPHTEGGPNPGYWNLPGWLLHQFARERELTERA